MILRLKTVLPLVLACVSASALYGQESAQKTRREIALGYNQSSGNSSTREILGRVDVELKRVDDEFKFFAECFNSSDDGKTSAERASGAIDYAYYFDTGKRWLHSFRLSGEHDRFSDIDLRSLVSTGVKYLVFKTDTLEAGADVSVGYEYTDFYAPEHDDTDELVVVPGVFIAKNFARGVRVSQTLKFFLYPGSSDAGHRIEARTAVQSALSERISLRLSLDNFYNSDPNPGIEEHDMRFVSSLVCSF